MNNSTDDRYPSSYLYHMKEIIDNFSDQSANYASYRPTYPDEFYQYLFSIVKHHDTAWDCGTGNGQIAVKLAEQFKLVYATDISQSQLDNAVKKDNIQYSKQRAEHTDLPPDSINLITVAQAIHWFDFEAFYAEVFRVAKPEGYIAISTYNLLKINPDIDHVINNLYLGTLKGYWDKERKYVDEAYRNISFPFRELETPQFVIHTQWNLDQLIGYLNTWSATKHYIGKNGKNPVDNILPQLQERWNKDEKKDVAFPLALRLGQIIK